VVVIARPTPDSACERRPVIALSSLAQLARLPRPRRSLGASGTTLPCREDLLTGLKRRRVHRFDPRMKAPACIAGIFFFGLQHESQRRKGNRAAQSAPRPVFGPARQGLCPAVGHAGPIQGICRSGRPDDEDATQLFFARSGRYPTCPSRSYKARRDYASRSIDQQIVCFSARASPLIIMPQSSNVSAFPVSR
jgi:hypothetical protein